MELEALLPEALAIARQAGRKILKIYETEFSVEKKDDRSPLTAADLAAHRCIVAGLSELTPDIPVFSEESAQVAFAERQSWDPYWLVDPLDGTKEFIKRNGEFTVNIALISSHKPVLGVVHVPVKDIDYFACTATGAFRQDSGGTPSPIRVSSLGAGPVRVVGSRSHRGPLLDAYLERLGEHEMVPMGSSLKLCLVADGQADVYPRLGLTSEWDTAAAQAVVECAGGTVLSVDGDPLRYNRKDELLNPFFIVFGDNARDWLSYL